MTDDIVTRLRDSFTKKDYPMLKDHCESCAIPKDWGGHHDNCLYDQAAYEIERLRTIIQDIANAVTDEGIKPGYYKQQVNYVRTMWNPLWQAIGKAVNEVRGD